MEEQNSTQKNIFLKPWFWVLAFLILVAVAGGFYYHYTFIPCADPGCYGVDVGVLPQEVPEGVDVIDLENGNRLVKNVMAGYQVEVGSDKFLYKDQETGEDLVIQDFAEPNMGYGGLPGCRAIFDISDDNRINNFEQEMKGYCNNVGPDCVSYSIEQSIVGDLNWTKGVLYGSFVGTDNPEYHTFVDGKTYSIYFLCADDVFIENILNNFSI